MTATLAPNDRQALLRQRLVDLSTERDRTLSEIAPGGSGDAADRATNVDGHVRLAMVEDRIAALETELARAGSRHASTGTVTEGDIVTLDFGDGPETFLLGAVENAADGVDVVTPGSPLGRAVLGATVGSSVDYSPRRGLTLSVTVVAVS